MGSIKYDHSKKDSTTGSSPPSPDHLTLKMIHENDEEEAGSDEDQSLLKSEQRDKNSKYDNLNEKSGVYDYIFINMCGLILNQELLEAVRDKKVTLVKLLRYYIELIYEVKLAVEQKNRTERQMRLKEKYIRYRNYTILLALTFFLIFLIYYFFL
jgi:hypothetical protein